MTAEQWYARWLFKLLDYEHYTVELADTAIGQVVINHADQSVAVVSYLNIGDEWLKSQLPKSYKGMRAWLREHEV